MMRYKALNILCNILRNGLTCYTLAKIVGDNSYLGCNKQFVKMAQPLNSDLALRTRISILD